jgi:hypothetical protein
MLLGVVLPPDIKIGILFFLVLFSLYPHSPTLDQKPSSLSLSLLIKSFPLPTHFLVSFPSFHHKPQLPSPSPTTTFEDLPPPPLPQPFLQQL